MGTSRKSRLGQRGHKKAGTSVSARWQADNQVPQNNKEYHVQRHQCLIFTDAPNGRQSSRVRTFEDIDMSRGSILDIGLKGVWMPVVIGKHSIGTMKERDISFIQVVLPFKLSFFCPILILKGNRIVPNNSILNAIEEARARADQSTRPLGTVAWTWAVTSSTNVRRFDMRCDTSVRFDCRAGHIPSRSIEIDHLTRRTRSISKFRRYPSNPKKVQIFTNCLMRRSRTSSCISIERQSSNPSSSSFPSTKNVPRT